MSSGALRGLVIGLGILILLSFAAVVVGIIGSSDLDSNGEIAKELRDLSLGLPAECAIQSAQSSGDRLTIVTQGPAGSQERCSRVFVVDTLSGDILAEVRP
jgi:hypothetical protein